MTHHKNSTDALPPATVHFYRHVLDTLQAAGVQFLVGGAYAFAHYTGIARHTKDLDLFVRNTDIERTVQALQSAGYRAEHVFSHWLAKAVHGDDAVDVIHNSGNGLCPVEDDWFHHAIHAEVLSTRVQLMPAEEMIWQKAYIMERERFDGADVIHLIRARGQQLDWDRLLARFNSHWRVLLSHVVLYGFTYPHDQDSIPGRVLRDLAARLLVEPPARDHPPACQGTLLSRTQYLPDMQAADFRDPRLQPQGSMTVEQLNHWTVAGRVEEGSAPPMAAVGGAGSRETASGNECPKAVESSTTPAASPIST